MTPKRNSMYINFKGLKAKIAACTQDHLWNPQQQENGGGAAGIELKGSSLEQDTKSTLDAKSCVWMQKPWSSGVLCLNPSPSLGQDQADMCELSAECFPGTCCPCDLLQLPALGLGSCCLESFCPGSGRARKSLWRIPDLGSKQGSVYFCVSWVLSAEVAAHGGSTKSQAPAEFSPWKAAQRSTESKGIWRLEWEPS